MGKNASVFAFLSDTGLCVDHPLFIAPFQSSAAATVYAACTYVLWGVCFTIQDVPFGD